TPSSLSESDTVPESDAASPGAETPRDHETVPERADPSGRKGPSEHADPGGGREVTETTAAEKDGEPDGSDHRPRPDGHDGDGRPVIEVSPGVHKRLTTGLGGFTMAMGVCLLLV